MKIEFKKDDKVRDLVELFNSREIKYWNIQVFSTSAGI